MNFFKEHKTVIIQAVLFLTTFTTTTMAGADWMGNGNILGSPDYSWDDFLSGLYFSIPFLGILTVHEFGHYLTAKYYKIKVTLPYYIPMWFQAPLIGTMGAVIKIKDAIQSRKEFFDVGIAGPLAGFIVAIGVIFYAFTHLPDPTHIYTIHPDYEQFGLNYKDHVYTYEYQVEHHRKQFEEAYPDEEFEAFPPSSYEAIAMGKNLTFLFFEKFVVDDPSLIPNKYEIMHYPWIFAGYLALLFTAINLLPIGQLDGGHVVYGLFGYHNHRKISEYMFFALIFYSGMGILAPNATEPFYFGIPPIITRIALYFGFLHFIFAKIDKKPIDKIMIIVFIMTGQFILNYIYPNLEGYYGWLLFALILGRVIGVYHPMAYHDQKLSTNRKILGWISLFVFVISFSPAPLTTGMDEGSSSSQTKSNQLDQTHILPVQPTTGRIQKVMINSQ